MGKKEEEVKIGSDTFYAAHIAKCLITSQKQKKVEHKNKKNYWGTYLLIIGIGNENRQSSTTMGAGVINWGCGGGGGGGIGADVRNEKCGSVVYGGGKWLLIISGNIS